MEIDVAALARRQLHDLRALQPGTLFAEAHPALSLRQAYAVQDEVVRLRVAQHEQVVGYKLGCLGPKIRRQFGMDGPIRGVVFADQLHVSGATISGGAYANLAIEGEMALRIGANGEIAGAFPVIELHHFVFRAPQKSLQELIANNGLNAGAVLPAIEDPLESWGGKESRLEITINGKPTDTAELWGLAGGPAATLSWLRQNLAESGLALQPGQIVLTGTLAGLYSVNPGDHVRVTAGGRRSVGLHVVA